MHSEIQCFYKVFDNSEAQVGLFFKTKFFINNKPKDVSRDHEISIFFIPWSSWHSGTLLHVLNPLFVRRYR